jgi:hypothetical protein
MTAIKKTLVTLLSVVAFGTSALAGTGVATISDVSGKVLVNQGEGFVPVAGSIELNAGDRVMVGDDSFATVTYADCSVSLSKPTVMAVSAEANCSDVVITPTADVPVAAGYPILPIVAVTAVAVGGIILIADPFKNKKNGTSAP